ncbi:MAG TPA: metalloregulator ArsR/SmtB family transcription factor [Bacillota bacterium]|nr:metalloregulator ArsR/SmtB family transcription factor [Bacillota bacterium]
MDMEHPDCDCCRIDIRPELTEAQARPLAERFAALADPNRLRLLEILERGGGQVCVCELVEALPISQPTISHHLRVLRSAGLVDYEKRGVWAYYHIRGEALAELQAHLRGLLSAPVKG